LKLLFLEIRKVLRSMNGDAEKALEWFLGQSSDAVESSPVDEEHITEYGKRARSIGSSGASLDVPSVPEKEPIASDGKTVLVCPKSSLL
jgi:hypothetical protein